MPQLNEVVTTDVETETEPVEVDETPKKTKAKTAKTSTKSTGKAKNKSKAVVKKTGKRRMRAEGQRSVNENEPQREPVWNDRRKAIIMALRKLGAVNASSGVVASKIADTASKMKEFPKAKVLGDKTETSHGPKGIWFTKWHLSPSLVNELHHNGFVQSTRVEGEREMVYFLTAKGKTTKFPAKEKKSKKDDE